MSQESRAGSQPWAASAVCCLACLAHLRCAAPGRALAQHCDSHRMAGKNGRRAHPVKRHFPRPEGQSSIMVFLASPHPVCRLPEHSGKINTHHHRNLGTRKPGQREPEFLGMERPRYGRKQRGKRGARGAARPGFQVSGTCAVLPADNTLHFVSQQLTADPAGDTFLDCGGERCGGQACKSTGNSAVLFIRDRKGCPDSQLLEQMVGRGGEGK